MRYLLISIVGGVHVAVIGGVLLMQGCGTTRGPVALPDSPGMPPAVAEEDLVTPVRGQTYKPVTIEAAVAALPAQPVAAPAPAPKAPVEASARTYVVGKGDTLSVIAKRYGVSMADLMVLNNISDPNRIRLGQTLKLPATAAKTPSAAVSAPVAAAPAAAGAGIYVVKAGDSLSVIAQRHGTTVSALQEINGLKDDRILVGQKLTLPAGARAPSPAPVSSKPAVPQQTVQRPVVEPAMPALSALGALAPEPPPSAAMRNTYTVKAGDDILFVASVHNVSIAELRRVNNLTTDTLIPGQTLIIPSVE